MLNLSFLWLLKGMLGLLDLIFFSKKKDIIFHGYLGVPSGNNLALYRYIKEHKALQCDLYWTGKTNNSASISGAYVRATPSRDEPLYVHVSYLFFLMRFKVIIVESAGDLSFYIRFLSKQRRLKILLAHGFCLKSSGILAQNLSRDQIKIWSQVGRAFNVISVSSQLEKYMASSTVNASPNDCVVMGPQRAMGARNRTESELSKARRMLQDAYAVKLGDDCQIIFYAPTHRDHIQGLKRPVLFGFESVLLLNEELIRSNTVLFVREHGISGTDPDDVASNIIYTSKAASIDFHLLYAGVDGLITDYSGIFLEYLTSHVKLGFWHYDILDYRQVRGFSISEDVFKTGSQVSDPNSFIEFIKLTSFSKEQSVSREFWHNLLYEKSTEEALWLTVDEIKRRGKFVTSNFDES
jgi:CDP-glycerol glycerophosphotransferase (TagB/SpsB family)